MPRVILLNVYLCTKGNRTRARRFCILAISSNGRIFDMCKAMLLLAVLGLAGSMSLLSSSAVAQTNTSGSFDWETNRRQVLSKCFPPLSRSLPTPYLYQSDRQSVSIFYKSQTLRCRSLPRYHPTSLQHVRDLDISLFCQKSLCSCQDMNEIIILVYLLLHYLVHNIDRVYAS